MTVLGKIKCSLSCCSLPISCSNAFSACTPYDLPILLAASDVFLVSCRAPPPPQGGFSQVKTSYSCSFLSKLPVIPIASFILAGSLHSQAVCPVSASGSSLPLESHVTTNVCPSGSHLTALWGTPASRSGEQVT